MQENCLSGWIRWLIAQRSPDWNDARKYTGNSQTQIRSRPCPSQKLRKDWKKPPFLSLKVAPNRVIHQTWCYCNKVLWIVDRECCCCPEHRAHRTLILHSDVNLQPAGEISQHADFIHISFLELFSCVALPFLAEFSCNTALLAPGESAAPCLLRFGYCVNQQGKGCVCIEWRTCRWWHSPRTHKVCRLSMPFKLSSGCLMFL